MNLHNIKAQMLHPDVKIFFIGFNRCATTSFHELLRRNSIKSSHFHFESRSLNPVYLRKFFSRLSFNMAIAIESRRDNVSLKKLLDRYTAYSDLSYFSGNAEIEAVTYFKRFHTLYNDAYFILNDRDVGKWIASRCNYLDGGLLRRAMEYHNTGTDGVKQIWRARREKHYKDVFSYFRTYDRFLHFVIDRDPIEKLTDFLQPSFVLNSEGWSNWKEKSQNDGLTMQRDCPDRAMT